ncbi:MAG: hypothetical protein Q8M17_09520 [Actinomycetota bacterium]|nr:hypothetical protein [Actinomycetota bacterium]
MSLELPHSLDRLVTAAEVDQSWLCRAARALDDLDDSLARLSSDVDGQTGASDTALLHGPQFTRAALQVANDRQRLHNRARSLRRRLVLATKDSRLGPDLKAELAGLSREASAYFRRVKLGSAARIGAPYGHST